MTALAGCGDSSAKLDANGKAGWQNKAAGDPNRTAEGEK
jgi:hypothetical protein